MSDAATALAIPDLDSLGDPKVTIRIGRQGRIWHAVAHIETPHGPMLIHARADLRGVLRTILRSPHLRRRAERISHGAIAPGALDQLAVHAGFSFPNPFKELAKFKPLAKIVENVAHGRVLQDVSRQLGKVVSQIPNVSKVISMGERAARTALGRVTNNPIWDMARTGISFIPGIGTGVSSGMAAAAAFGRGQSAQDIALAAARGALPGGELARLAWDVGVGLAKNPSLDGSAMKVVQSQLGNLVANRLGGAAGGLVRQATASGTVWVGATPAASTALDTINAAFKAGLTVARTKGRPLNRSNMSVLAEVLPHSAAGERIARLASNAMVQSHYRNRAIVAYNAALKVFQRLEARDPFAFAELRQLQAQAAQGNHKSRVALAVLETVRRTHAARAALPSTVPAANAAVNPVMAEASAP